MRCIHDPIEARVHLRGLSKRTNESSQKNAIATVKEILHAIEKEGDKALVRFTEKFDGFTPNPIKISQEELVAAWNQTPIELKGALELAQKRIQNFHEKQIPLNIKLVGKNGEILQRRWRAVEKAGIYIPGGRASYPSTVLMNAIPAQVAGVKEIIMVSPAGIDQKINRTVLAAAHLTGIKDVFKIGGAQAIGALAFGTESVPMVDVISGPGNLYVTLAKKEVYGKVGIDSLAGPSEVLIIADHTANIKHVACDLLAQAEHDPLAATVLLTTESSLARNLAEEIDKQLENHPRSEICKSSLRDWGLIVTCEDLDQCIELSDEFAPEHLELLVEKPNILSERIKNAGAIFIGPWTPEAVGDYLAGPNHTLPTSGTAKFSGALGVETFMKNTSIIEFNETALNNTSKEIRSLANSEGLHSHSESIRIRINR
tara:strand:+ start:1162 stop:2448 length:1287 start_codon:yes stop_codon:yes gene_type:complete